MLNYLSISSSCESEHSEQMCSVTELDNCLEISRGFIIYSPLANLLEVGTTVLFLSVKKSQGLSTTYLIWLAAVI